MTASDTAWVSFTSQVRRGVLVGEGSMNERFTAAQLAAAAARGQRSGRGLVHLGTHFDLRPGNMTRSSLLLGSKSTSVASPTSVLGG